MANSKNYIENSKSDVTILLTTCDKYKDAWHPFFELWKIQWPDCPYNFVINTETIDYNRKDFNIRVFKGGNGISWSKRLKKCLKSIDSEYVLLVLEDYFLQSPVKTEIFEKALKCMKGKTDVGVIQFAIDINTRCDKNDIYYDYFANVPVSSKKANKYRIFCVLSLWRKNYLYKLLKSKENPWEFETFGSLRSTYYRETVLREIPNDDRCFVYYIEPKYGYAISRSKWLPKNAELFEKYAIDVDFSNLGVLENEEYEKHVDRYYGIKRNNEDIKPHHSTKEKIFLLLNDPKEFWDIVKNIIKKQKLKLKYKFPFI